MRKLLFLVLFAFISNFYGQAQDYMVTVKGDTFECKITKVSDRFVHFDYKAGDEIRTTVILLDQVSSYNKSKASGPSGEKTISNSKGSERVKTYNSEYKSQPDRYNKYATDKSDESKEETLIFRMSIFGGISHLIGKGEEGLSIDLKANEDELRSGAHFGLNFLFFPNQEKAGFGVRINSFSSSHSGSFSFFNPDLNE